MTRLEKLTVKLMKLEREKLKQQLAREKKAKQKRGGKPS